MPYIPPPWAQRVTRGLQLTGVVLRRLGIIQVTIQGRHYWDSVPADKGVVVAANHTAVIDALYLQLCSPRTLRLFAQLWMFESKRWGVYMAAAGHLPVTHDNPRLRQRSAREALEILQAGGAVGIFPEGKYSAKPRLLELQDGAGWLSRVGDVPILPVAIHGTSEVLPWYENPPEWVLDLSRFSRLKWVRHFRWIPRRRRVRIVIGPPIFPKGRTTKALTEELTAALAAQVARARGCS